MDKWSDAALYESYVGRWSRITAGEFLKWLNLPDGLAWLDVGCGTGALSEKILQTQNPQKLTGVDSSEYHVDFARRNISDSRAEFHIASAEKMPLKNDSVDVIVSGLVLNFIPNIEQTLGEFKRILKKGGTAAAYVWDYAGRMEMMRYFWDAAVYLFEDAIEKDEGIRFPMCNPESLRALFKTSELRNIEVTNIDIPTVFKNFDDYWSPFLSGIGPAPGYCMSLSEENRQRLKTRLLETLPIKKDGSIELMARAVAVKGVK